MKNIFSHIRYLYGLPIDDRSDPGQRDGFGPFGALGTFALAQGVALTAVAKDSKRIWIVLAVYTFAVLFTIAWIAATLKLTIISEKGQPVSAFNSPSLKFGRWTQTWTLFLGAVMFILGLLGMLPNQTWRVFYGKATIPSTPVPVLTRGAADTGGPKSSVEEEKLNMDRWIEWMALGHRPSTDQFLWVQQSDPFNDFYVRFDAYVSIALAPGATLDPVAAFLVKGDGVPYRPVYRQLPFRRDSNSVNLAVLSVDQPDPGEGLVLLIGVSGPAKKPDEYGIKIKTTRQ